MDRWIALAILMLLGWGITVVATDAPGWVHLFLTAGVALLIWRVVTRDTPSGPVDGTTSGATGGNTSGKGSGKSPR